MSAPWLRNGSTSGSSAAAHIWSEHVANDNRTYYWNSETKTASWEKPDALKSAEERAAKAGAQSTSTDDGDDWKEYETGDGKKYYHNHTTGVTTWDKPEALAKLASQSKQKACSKTANGNGPEDDEVEAQTQQELERLDRINVVGADGKAISAAMYALSDEAVPSFKTTELAEEAFHKMLRKNGVQTDWTWDQTMRAAIKDPVWRALPSTRARKAAFEQYVVDLKKATIGKQKDRIEKLKQDFERMLRRHDEIKYYSQWHNVRGNLDGELAYKAAIDEEERVAMFNTYVEKLEAEELQAERQRTLAAKSAFSDHLRDTPIDLTTTWRAAQEQFRQTENASQDKIFDRLGMLDMLLCFEEHIKNLDRERTNEMRVKKALLRQEQRQNRRNFSSLLQELRSAGQIYAGSTWRSLYELVKDAPKCLALVGQSGSSPIDLFWDVCEEMDQELRGKKTLVYDVLDTNKQRVTLETSLEEFCNIMQADNRTSHINSRDMKSIYKSLHNKARQKAEDEKKTEERRTRRKQDDLRSAMKKLEPPIGIKDSYEDVRLRISMLVEFTALDTEESRQGAFDKYIRRLKERIEDEEDRSARRDRHSHRHSPTRDRRDRDRRSSRESRRSGNDDRERHDSRRRHRDDRHGSFSADPRSPKRSKHERPRPVDEPMLDYGPDMEVNAKTAEKTSGGPDANSNGSHAAVHVSPKGDDAVQAEEASEDGEIPE